MISHSHKMVFNCFRIDLEENIYAKLMSRLVLQIRWGFEGKSEVLFLISHQKHML